jgi:hypothetical protein
MGGWLRRHFEFFSLHIVSWHIVSWRLVEADFGYLAWRGRADAGRLWARRHRGAHE